jgi:hypothetical protein
MMGTGIYYYALGVTAFFLHLASMITDSIGLTDFRSFQRPYLAILAIGFMVLGIGQKIFCSTAETGRKESKQS